MENLLNIAYIAAVSIFVLFMPGFFLSLMFFRANKIDIIERIALSFALSISVVPLLVFYANLIGFKISALLVIAIVFIVSIPCFVIYMITPEKGRKKKKK